MPTLASTTGYLLPQSGVLSHVPIDWIILVVFAALVLFDAIRAGSRRAVTLSLAFPISVFLFNLLPQTAYVGPALKNVPAGTGESVLFIAFLVILFFLIHRMMSVFSSSAGFVHAIFSALAATAVSVVMWLQEPALQNIWHFSPQVQHIFGMPYALLWMIVAYVALTFARSNR